MMDVRLGYRVNGAVHVEHGVAFDGAHELGEFHFVWYASPAPRILPIGTKHHCRGVYAPARPS